MASEGELHKAGGEFSPCVVGDFSALREPGLYRIQIGEQTSGSFRIGEDVYDAVIARISDRQPRNDCLILS